MLVSRRILFLVAVLGMTALTGCSDGSDDQQKELKVCVSGCDRTSTFFSEFETILSEYKREHSDVKIDVDVISEKTSDEARIKQLKTDIMSGKGPDVFIVQSPGLSTVQEENQNYLFANAGKAVESGVFGNLDKYIKEDQQWETYAVCEEALKAGSYQEHQYLLPLSIDFPLLIQREEATDFSEMETFVQCLEVVENGGDRSAKSELYGLASRSARWLPEDALDQEKQKILFGKDTYLQLSKQLSLLADHTDAAEETALSGPGVFAKSTFEEAGLDYQLLPTMSGDKAAFIGSYGAVSANASDRELGYDFLSCFLEEQNQTRLQLEGYPVNRNALLSYLEGKEAKDAVAACYDDITACVFMTEGSLTAGEKIRAVMSQAISGEAYSDKDAEQTAEEIYKKYEMILKE